MSAGLDPPAARLGVGAVQRAGSDRACQSVAPLGRRHSLGRDGVRSQLVCHFSKSSLGTGSGGVGANSRWGHSGFMHPGRIDLRAFLRCASSFLVGGYLLLPMLAGGILIRFRLCRPRGHRRGCWFRFLLTAEQAPKKSHHPTSYLAAIVRLGTRPHEPPQRTGYPPSACLGGLLGFRHGRPPPMIAGKYGLELGSAALR